MRVAVKGGRVIDAACQCFEYRRVIASALSSCSKPPPTREYGVYRDAVQPSGQSTSILESGQRTPRRNEGFLNAVFRGHRLTGQA
jgi:hypothetical protein